MGWVASDAWEIDGARRVPWLAEFRSIMALGKHCPGTWGEAWEAKSRLRA